MATIKIEATGISPLMMSRITDESMLSMAEGHRKVSTPDDDQPRQQAEKRLYLSSNGTKKPVPVIPHDNLFRCLIEGGRFHKVGRNKVTTQKSSILAGAMTLHGSEFAVEHQKPWEVHVGWPPNQATGGRNVVYRPIFYDWKFCFEVDLDESLIPTKLFRMIVDSAGKAIGMMERRPDRKGGFGKFVVTSWEDQDDKA